MDRFEVVQALLAIVVCLQGVLLGFVSHAALFREVEASLRRRAASGRPTAIAKMCRATRPATPRNLCVFAAAGACVIGRAGALTTVASVVGMAASASRAAKIMEEVSPRMVMVCGEVFVWRIWVMNDGKKSAAHELIPYRKVHDASF